MSYYTYFKPTKDKYNPDNLSTDELNQKVSQTENKIKELKLYLRLYMIAAYYEGSLKYINHIQTYFNSLVYCLKKAESYRSILWIDSELKEYNMVGINHADCPSEYYLKDLIKSDNERIDKAFEELLILSSIKPFHDKKDPDEESAYLREEFQNDMDSIFDGLEGNIAELSQDQFMLDYFDTKKTESELSEEENNKEKE